MHECLYTSEAHQQCTGIQLTVLYIKAYLLLFFVSFCTCLGQVLEILMVCEMKKKHLFHTVIISFLFKFIAIHKLSNLKCRAKVLNLCKITHTNPPREYRESIACNPHLKTTYAVYQTLSFMIRCQMILSFYLLKVRALIKIQWLIINSQTTFQEKQACRPLYIKSLAIYRDSDNI